MLDVLKGGKWFRGDGQVVNRFESEYARLTGSKHCPATANGTSALLASLGALGVQPCDEVIVPPYTFVATINAVLMFHALPVFVDTDIDTFQIDARKIEAAITERTTVILPVHLGGSAADPDAIMKLGRARGMTWNRLRRPSARSGPAPQSWRKYEAMEEDSKLKLHAAGSLWQFLDRRDPFAQRRRHLGPWLHTHGPAAGWQPCHGILFQRFQGRRALYRSHHLGPR